MVKIFKKIKESKQLETKNRKKIKKMNDREGFQAGGPAHHSPSSGVRRLSDSTHQARPRYFVRGGGVAVRGKTYRGVS